jgi:hypothetical protein
VNLASEVKHLNSEVADAKLEISDQMEKKAVEGREERERERERRIVKTTDRLRSCEIGNTIWVLLVTCCK